MRWRGMSNSYAEFMRRASKSKAGETTSEKLARMRQTLKDATAHDKKAADRADGGQFIKHPDTNDLTWLLAHMATEHGLAILPQHRMSTRNAQASHLVAHQTGADHGVE